LPGLIFLDFQKASWNGFSWFARLVSCATCWSFWGLRCFHGQCQPMYALADSFMSAKKWYPQNPANT
jgi:hypothetical protein